MATFLSPPPPPQQQQEQQQQQPEAEIQSTPRGPKWVVIGALLLLVVVETLRGMPSAPSSEGMAYRVGYGVGGAILNLVPILAVSLVAGASPVETRVGRSEATLSATLYSWPIAAVVVVSTLIALLI